MNCLDVVIIGGGVQGIWLLNELDHHGYSTLLVTDRSLGEGQTLHSHLYLHRGHLYTEIALAQRLAEVNLQWDAFLTKKPNVQLGANPYFILPYPAAVLWQALWKAADLEPGKLDSMPEIFHEGIFSPGVAIRTPERWIDGKRLVEALAEPVLKSIRRGRVLDLDMTSRTIEVECGGQRTRLEPKFVVLAAGAGNQDLLRLAARNTRLAKEAAGAQRLRKSMMVVLRGADLPKISCIVPDFPLFMVNREDQEKTVWLGSYGIDEVLEHPVGHILDPDPPPSPRRIAKTLRMLESLVPSILSMDLDWGVYTGLKSERVKDATLRGVPSEEAIETFGLDRFATVWPTKLTLAPFAAARLLDMIQQAIPVPSGSLDAAAAGLPNGAPSFGDEKWRGVDWLGLRDFRRRYGV